MATSVTICLFLNVAMWIIESLATVVEVMTKKNGMWEHCMDAVLAIAVDVVDADANANT